MSRVSQLAACVFAWALLGTVSTSADPNYGYQRGNPYPYPPVYAPPAYPAPAQPQVTIPQGSPVTVVVAPNARIITTAPPNATLPAGWVWARPANCGEYRYWNGTECLDARDYPPDLSAR
ncbi:MAG: hypothetical protein MPJ78_01975 [Hyphomicrobiaceae bacterium]|nr:hypothetical protein [Hyphomicrobiaceae bacterium]